MDVDIAGFWSYSHDDDERDGHRLLRLAASIQAEFALVTGESLTLFIDRKDILWGDEWRRRIGTALAETTFFIPIITPLYFKRQECRSELLSFIGQAQSLGAIELVMPILYVDVPDLTENSTDEACALVARMQWVDWRELRLSDEESAEYRRAVNSLARRLAEISKSYEQSESRPIVGDSEDADEDGIMDLLGALEQKLPGWQELVGSANTAAEQLNAVYQTYTKRIAKAESFKTTGAMLIVLRDLASDTEPIYRRAIQYSKDTLATSVSLDPLILKTLRSLDAYPEFAPNVLRVLSPVIEMVESELTPEAKKKRQVGDSFRGFAVRYKGISKDFRRTVSLGEIVDRYAEDNNSLVLNWYRKIQEFKKLHE
jgi:TIR domain